MENVGSSFPTARALRVGMSRLLVDCLVEISA